MNELFIEKRTQLEYQKEKFKKRHGFIPDYSKDPYGNTGTIVGDDGKRIDFSFSGGSTKKTKYVNPQKTQAPTGYCIGKNKIDMNNASFSPRVRNSEDFIFNHEYGHAKVDRHYQSYMQDKENNRKSGEYVDKAWNEATPYAKNHKNYKDDHDVDTEETIADVNGIVNTKNGEKVFRKFSQDNAKRRAAVNNHQVTKTMTNQVRNSINKDNRDLNSGKDRLQKTRYFGIRKNLNKRKNIQEINQSINKNQNLLNNLNRNLEVQPTTDRYRYRDNMAATKNPTLRNFANNK